MRHYQPDYSDVGISRERYRELLNFCRQFGQWIHEKNSITGLMSQSYASGTHIPGKVSDTVLQAVIRRDALDVKIKLIQNTATQIDHGQWYAALIQNVCYGVSVYCLRPEILPTSNRNEFFKAKKAFFVLLDQKRG